MGPCLRFYTHEYITFWILQLLCRRGRTPKLCLPAMLFQVHVRGFHVGAPMLLDRDALRTLSPNHLEWLIHLFIRNFIVFAGHRSVLLIFPCRLFSLCMFEDFLCYFVIYHLSVHRISLHFFPHVWMLM